MTEMSKWCDGYKGQLEARRKARVETTASLAEHATWTYKELSGALSTPEVAAGGRGEGEVRSMELVARMSVVNWGALTPERVCKEAVECGHEPADACSVNTQQRRCLTLQESFIRRQLTVRNPITLGRMRQKRRRRNAKKVAALIAATNCVTVGEGDEETSTAEAEPAEMTLEETEEAEAESVAAQAEETEAVEAEPEVDLEETEEAKAEEAAVAVAEQEKAEPIEITMATLYTSSVGIDLSSINLDKVKKHHSLYRRQKS